VADRILRGIRIWRLLFWAALRSELADRTSLVLGIVGGVTVQCAGLAFVATVLSRFQTIGGWSLPELMLLYGMRLTAHAFWVVPFGALFQVDHALRDGEFDRYLTRPAGPLMQLTTRRIPITTPGHLIAGGAILVAGIVTSGVTWGPLSVLLLLVALCGGAMIEMSLQLAAASLSFRLHQITELMLTIDSVWNTCGNFPVNIFGSTARWLMTILFPIAFAAYFPSSILLEHEHELWIPSLIAGATPIVGTLMMLISYKFWKSQIRHYESSGA
jgi:ABC-2 type transport system permease protein